MENKMIAIIGNGEIGSSLVEVYREKNIDPMVRDLDFNTINDTVEILNICLPYSKNFTNIANDYIAEYRPKLTIIHSTVPVGTTKKLNSNCVHSPVRGIHPNLKEGIEKFVKFIGYNDLKSKNLAENHFDSLGIKYYSTENSDSSELAKLTSTTYYGLCIAWHGEMKKMCDKHNIDFDVINKWTDSYNNCYSEMGMPNVVRPNLYPPESGIGGHCVIPNTELLNKEFNSKALELILEYKK